MIAQANDVSAGEVWWDVLWFALFIGWLALGIWSIVHCLLRFRPPGWAMVVFGALLLLVPFLGVAIYWLVYFVVVKVNPARRYTPTPIGPVGWFADPFGRFEFRYWDGARWTEHVSSQGRSAIDAPVGSTTTTAAVDPT